MGTNKKKGRILEENYEWLWQLGINKNCVITSPKYYQDTITGESREIDVFIESYDNSGNLLNTIMVECRNRNNVQDVTWVEQVVTKKNDLKIDRAIMVTTSSFTEPARIKAKYYNIEVERSSSLTEDFIDEKKEECKATARFLFMECVAVLVYSDKGCYTHKQLNDYEDIKNYVKNQILSFSYGDYFVTELHQNHIFKENETKFFSDLNNVINITFSFEPAPVTCDNNILMNITNTIGKIKKIVFEIKIMPKTFHFPLSKVITIFDDDVEIVKSNKRHKSLYENDKIKICVQFHNEEIHYDITLKRINRYWRYIGYEMTMYALLKNIHKTTAELNNNPKDVLGEIYFGDIF